jgi:peptide/nickel transport system permease protein
MRGPHRPDLLIRLIRVIRHDFLTAALAIFLLVVVVMAVLAPLIAPYDPIAQDLPNALQGPSAAHWLGTDDLGRDVLSRIMYGARVSLWASLQSVGVALLLAVPIGLLAGYKGGQTDNVIMRILDVMLALPGLILVIALATALGGGLTKTMLALSVVFIPSLARITRAETLSVRHEAYIEASMSIGTSTPRILSWRVLRNIAPVLQVQAAITLGIAIGLEGSLSFIGLGVQPPQASWGTILRRSFEFIFTNPIGVLWPALFITLSAWAFNAIGDALGDTVTARGGSNRRGFQALTAVRRGKHGEADTSGVTATPDRPVTEGATEALLDVRGLSVAVESDHGTVLLVEDVSFRLPRGEVLGIVGESGSGKTVTALSLLRLFASPPGVIVAGDITLSGHDVTSLGARGLRELRGSAASMIFQNPKASLNPALRIGDQIAEVLRLHEDLSAAGARTRAEELLEQVGIEQTRFGAYPHQLSGGMCQRVMVAMAIACRPPLLIADEPTSALDVTVQAEILDLLHDLKADGTSIVLITHDFGVVADICDQVVVMYAGQIVERGSVSDVLTAPAHPYTRALLLAMPSAGRRGTRLASIEGQVPLPGSHDVGCRFADRCPLAIDACRTDAIPLLQLSDGRDSRCIRIDDVSSIDSATATGGQTSESDEQPTSEPVERYSDVSPR